MSYRYSLLPTHNYGSDSPQKPRNHPQSFITNVFLSRRYARFFILAFLFLTCIVLLTPNGSRPWLSNPQLWMHHLPKLVDHRRYPSPLERPPEINAQPPLFERYSAYEEALPQHDDSLPFPEDSSRKFLYFADHVWGLGWGNAMQEMILNAQLAYQSGRTFVFNDYTWNREGPYSEFNGKLIPSRIPLSALLAGPIAGQSYSNSTTAKLRPRAVSRQYYDTVCPDPHLFDPREIKNELSPNATALQIMLAFVKKLENMDDRCVEVQKDTSQVFDYWLLGSTRLHDIVPTLINSPILEDFAWSPLINHVFKRNKHHFSTRSSLISILFPYFSGSTTRVWGSDMTPTPPASQTQPLPVLALHLRRGDFIEHCDHLYEWLSTYTGFNTQPSLPDRLFIENATLRDSMSPDEIREAYRGKCLVDIDKVRKRVVRAVKEWRAERLKEEKEKRKGGFWGWWRMRGEEERVRRMLRKVYVMTNGDHEFLDELKSALISDAQRSTRRSGKKFKPQDINAKSTPDSLSEEYDFDFTWSWNEVSTSRDLAIGWETKYVAQAMDMYVGQRAEVFVGNGFSSLTANVVLLRSVAGVETWRTRFW